MFEGCTIHAFEPQQAQFAEMQRRLGGAERVVLNRAALGATVGSATLHRTSHAESASLLPLNPGSWFAEAMGIRSAGEESVPVETIDHYCAAHAIDEIDLLKLDVQGFEPECLRGAQAMLARGRIRVIQAELLCHAMYERSNSFSDFDALLNPHGYRLYTIFNIHCGDDTGELLYLDTVYMRA
jgi:FkbM family methyltransferase